MDLNHSPEKLQHMDYGGWYKKSWVHSKHTNNFVAEMWGSGVTAFCL